MADSSAFVVKAPFKDSPTGDCILQTPDGTQFVVHRLVLSLASQVWNDMFSLPQAPEGFSITRPIIPVEEDPETLEALLTMVYPLPPPRIKSYDQATLLVQACDKYFIDVSQLDNILHKVLRTTAALEADPLGVYALAWKLGLDDEAKEASRYTHRLNLKNPKVKSDLIRRSGSVNSLLALWDLRLQREAALDELVQSTGVNGDTLSGCPYHGRVTSSRQWDLKEYLNVKISVTAFLRRPYPKYRSMKEFFGIENPYLDSRCDECVTAAQRKDSAAKRATEAALEKYPQTITGIFLNS